MKANIQKLLCAVGIHLWGGSYFRYEGAHDTRSFWQHRWCSACGIRKRRLTVFTRNGLVESRWKPDLYVVRGKRNTNRFTDRVTRVPSTPGAA